ncbi:hypothetical protein [Pseudomonas sp. CBZ-4]|uniref:hypothetical protein n=1 Tax=Pseudomonas sp. CBZ-4 TaxID=1163065 RepID=UPI0012FA29BC|nr:hypothetical protein [Pseudomonas sp. CBZ-4]
MSIRSINNISTVMDVRQVVPVESLVASNSVLEPHKESRPGAIRVEAAVVENNTDMLNKMAMLFTAFFNQLMGLMGEQKDPRTVDIAPKPKPEVAPQVTPVPVPPRPKPEANIPGLSNARNGTKPRDIWGGFRQGPDGNCVTVSAIKAAMHRFGQSPTDIYKEVTKIAGGYRVVMRDNYPLTLTDLELKQGARGAQFIGPDKEMLKDAQFLFAVSAKRAQMENNDRTAGRNYNAAISSLNNGEDETGPGEGFKRLGLTKHMKRVSVGELARGQVGMCNRTGHSVAVIDGREELWGRKGGAPRRGDAVALI